MKSKEEEKKVEPPICKACGFYKYNYECGCNTTIPLRSKKQPEEVKPEGECTHEPKMTCPDCIGDENDNQTEQPNKNRWYDKDEPVPDWGSAKKEPDGTYSLFIIDTNGIRALYSFDPKTNIATIKPEQPEQTAEGMSMDEIKHKVARELKKASWDELLYWGSSSNGFQFPEAFDMAAERYASQSLSQYKAELLIRLRGTHSNPSAIRYSLDDLTQIINNFKP